MNYENKSVRRPVNQDEVRLAEQHPLMDQLVDLLYKARPYFNPELKPNTDLSEEIFQELAQAIIDLNFQISDSFEPPYSIDVIKEAAHRSLAKKYPDQAVKDKDYTSSISFH